MELLAADHHYPVYGYIQKPVIMSPNKDTFTQS